MNRQKAYNRRFLAALGLLGLLSVLAVTVGCRSRAVSDEPDDANAVIDKAVAAGADIPPAKRSIVARVLRLSEKDLILGLYTFAELSGGHYPASLDTKSTLKQVETDRLGSAMPELSESTKERMLQDIFFASAFYEKLQREGRNVQYHGDTVGRQDAGKVLLCWTASKGRHRVVLGDLSIQTLTAEQLAGLKQ
jgi:hypothetical protein